MSAAPPDRSLPKSPRPAPGPSRLARAAFSPVAASTGRAAPLSGKQIVYTLMQPRPTPPVAPKPAKPIPGLVKEQSNHDPLFHYKGQAVTGKLHLFIDAIGVSQNRSKTHDVKTTINVNR